MVWDIQSLEDSEQKDDPINRSINHKGVYRTALGTPGLPGLLKRYGPLHGPTLNDTLVLPTIYFNQQCFLGINRDLVNFPVTYEMVQVRQSCDYNIAL